MAGHKKDKCFRLVKVALGVAYLAVTIATLNSCGPALQDDAQPKIYGGKPVLPGQLEGVVALHDQAGLRCTGTLIHPLIVLTAAHCIGKDVQQPGSAPSPIESVVVGSGAEGGQPGKDDTRLSVRSRGGVVAHPRYRRHPRGNMDLALIFLDQPAPVAKSQIPALLTKPLFVRQAMNLELKSAQQLVQAPQLTMAGFGQREDGGNGRKFFAETYGHQMNASEIALGGSGIDSCTGDSGGPVFSSSGALLGVISRGLTIGCGSGGIGTVAADGACWIRKEADKRGIEFPVDQPCQNPDLQALALKEVLSNRSCPAPACERLDLSDWYLESIAGLHALVPTVEHLNLKGNHLVDVSELLMMKGLVDVDIAFNDIPRNQIARLEANGVKVLGSRLQTRTFLDTPLRQVCRRAPLTWSAGETAMIKALRARFGTNDCDTLNMRVVKATKLSLANREILETELLADLPLLQHLDLSGNPLTSLAPLLRIERLKSVDLQGVPATLIESDHAHLEKLRARGVQVILDERNP